MPSSARLQTFVTLCCKIHSQRASVQPHVASIHKIEVTCQADSLILTKHEKTTSFQTVRLLNTPNLRFLDPTLSSINSGN